MGLESHQVSSPSICNLINACRTRPCNTLNLPSLVFIVLLSFAAVVTTEHIIKEKNTCLNLPQPNTMSRYTDRCSDEGFPMRHTFRSPLARAVYDRMIHQQRNQNTSHSEWYKINKEKLPGSILEHFVEFHKDEESCKFLENCYEKADWIFTQIWQGIAKSFLTWFITVTSANGLLSRGSMFVFSAEQFHALLNIDASWKAESLLDLGAGDGVVTQVMDKSFHKVYATEVSKPMIWKLQERNYQVVGLDEWSDGSVKYDVVSCLNLLDRCLKPLTILRDIKNSLKPGGRLIVAVVLPFSPFVEVGTKQNEPFEEITLKGRTFEDHVHSFIEDVFKPNGFIVERFTRLPYLCEGDLHQSFYFLDDAVFVLRVADHNTQTTTQATAQTTSQNESVTIDVT